MNPLEDDDESGWPDEPDEFDPDSLGPDVPDSEPTLEESLEATSEAPEDLVRAFWASVLLLNVAVGAVSVGAMLIYFRGDYRIGGTALLIGAFAALATGRYYWGVKTGRYLDDTSDAGDEVDTE